jgi:hypothetical protein
MPFTFKREALCMAVLLSAPLLLGPLFAVLVPFFFH